MVFTFYALRFTLPVSEIGKLSMSQQKKQQQPDKTAVSPKKPSACTHLQKAAETAAPVQSGGLNGSLDAGQQLSVQDTAVLQQTYGNMFVQKLMGPGAEEESEDTADVSTMPLNGGGSGAAAGGVEAAIEQSRGSGQQLPAKTRSKMEGFFGADFGNVSIHTGSEANHLSRSLGARSFTTGSDIYFSEGEYDPASEGGQKLIAHELTHVVQQGGTRRQSPQAKLTVGEPDDQYEQEAEVASEAAVKQPDPEAAPPPAESPDIKQNPGVETAVTPATTATNATVPSNTPNTSEVDQALGQADEVVEELAKGEGEETAVSANDPAQKVKEEKETVENQAAQEARAAAQEAPDGDPEQAAAQKSDETPKEKTDLGLKVGPGKPKLPDQSEAEALYEQAAIEEAEPEVADPLPNWNQLAYGTVQLTSMTAEELAWRDQQFGAGGPDVSLDDDNKADAQKDIEAQFATQFGSVTANPPTEEEDLDRDQMLREAIGGGIAAGIVQGGTEFVADLLVSQVTGVVPGGQGLLSLTEIAVDPAGWAKGVEKTFAGPFKADGIFNKKISDEDTDAGRVALVFEYIMGAIDWVNGILGFFNQILGILIGVLTALAAILGALPFGATQAIAAAIMKFVAFLSKLVAVITKITSWIGILKPFLQMMIMICRAVDLKQSQADPDKLRQKQAELRNSVQSFTASVTNRALSTAKDAIKEKYNTYQDKKKLRKEYDEAPETADDPKVKTKADLEAEFAEKYGESPKKKSEFATKQEKKDADKAARDRNVAIKQVGVAKAEAAVRQQTQAEADTEADRVRQAALLDGKSRTEADNAANQKRQEVIDTAVAKDKSVKSARKEVADMRKKNVKFEQSAGKKGLKAAGGVGLAVFKIATGIDVQELAKTKDDFTGLVSAGKDAWVGAKEFVGYAKSKGTVDSERKTKAETAVSTATSDFDTEKQTQNAQDGIALKTKLNDITSQKEVAKTKTDAATTAQQEETQSQQTFNLAQQEATTKKQLLDTEIRQKQTAQTEADNQINDLTDRIDNRLPTTKQTELNNLQQQETTLQRDIQNEQDFIRNNPNNPTIETHRTNLTNLQKDLGDIPAERTRINNEFDERIRQAQAEKQRQQTAKQEAQQAEQELNRQKQAEDNRVANLQRTYQDKQRAKTQADTEKQQAETTLKQLQDNLIGQDTSTLTPEALQRQTEAKRQEALDKLTAYTYARQQVQQAQDKLDAIEGERKQFAVFKQAIGFEGSAKKKASWGNWLRKGSTGPGFTDLNSGLNKLTKAPKTATQMLGDAIVPLPSSIRDWAKRYGKDKMMALSLNYQGGLPNPKDDTVEAVPNDNGKEAVAVRRVTNTNTMETWLDSHDFAANASEAIQAQLNQDDVDGDGNVILASARKKEMYNEQARTYLREQYLPKMMAQHLEGTADSSKDATVKSMDIDKDNAPASFTAVARKPTSEVDYAVVAKPVTLKFKDGPSLEFKPLVTEEAKEETDDDSNLEEAIYSYHYEPADPEAYQQALAQGKAATGQQMAAYEIKSTMTGAADGTTRLANKPMAVKMAAQLDALPDERKDSEGFTHTATQANYAEDDPFWIPAPLVIKGDDLNEGKASKYRAPKIEAKAVPATFKDDNGVEYQGKLKPDNKDKLSLQNAEEKSLAGDNIPQEKLEIAYTAVLDDNNASPSGTLTLQAKPDERRAASGQGLFLQRQVDEDEEMGDEPPIPAADERSLEEIKYEREREMIRHLPEPPEESIHQINESSTAYNSLRLEEYSLSLQQQQTRSMRLETEAQLIETEAAQKGLQTNMAGVAVHQSELDEKAQAQEEMAQIATDGQQPAQQGFSVSGEIAKLLQGIITPLISGLTEANKETGSSAGAGEVNQVSKGVGETDQAMGEGVELLKHDAAKARGWRAETAGMKADSISEQQRLLDTQSELEADQEAAHAGLGQMSEAEIINENMLEEVVEQKEDHEWLHEEAVYESELWADEHQTMRLDLFSKLEADLAGEEERRLGV
jgi:hypothetical protein